MAWVNVFLSVRCVWEEKEAEKADKKDTVKRDEPQRWKTTLGD